MRNTVLLLCVFASLLEVHSFSRGSLGHVRHVRQVGGHSTSPKPTPDIGGVPDGFYHMNAFDRFALNLFRSLVQKQTGYASPQPGYDGLIDQARQYVLEQRKTTQEQQQMVKNVLNTIAGPAAPWIYKVFMAPWPWAPLLTSMVTPLVFRFLVGPNWIDKRKDGGLGGVYVEKCRFLHETGCKGLCLNMCKVPTEQFFKETLGLDMTMSPDFKTSECRLSFGIRPLPVADDPDVPKGCLEQCKLAPALREAERKSVCSE